MDLQQSAQSFRDEIEGIKGENPPRDFTWYGYDTLANLHPLQGLFDGTLADFLSGVGGPIADVGGADGEVAYFLERLGHEAHIIDYPRTNWNGLRGAYRLKELLRSEVAIHEIDLDSQFRLPATRFGLILFLGTLYHLKNPFYVLEQFARASRWIAISTRIAKQTRDGATALEDIPVAYLLGPDECNNDATNFWIFSRAGLERILDRSGWTARKLFTAGDTEASNPSDPDHDERAFVLAESRVFQSGT